MFTTGNYQRNANQNYNEISPYTSQNDYHKKNPQTKNTGEGVEKRICFKKKKICFCTVGGNVN